MPDDCGATRPANWPGASMSAYSSNGQAGTSSARPPSARRARPTARRRTSTRTRPDWTGPGRCDRQPRHRDPVRPVERSTPISAHAPAAAHAQPTAAPGRPEAPAPARPAAAAPHPAPAVRVQTRPSRHSTSKPGIVAVTARSTASARERVSAPAYSETTTGVDVDVDGCVTSPARTTPSHRRHRASSNRAGRATATSTHEPGASTVETVSINATGSSPFCDWANASD